MGAHALHAARVLILLWQWTAVGKEASESFGKRSADARGMEAEGSGKVDDGWVDSDVLLSSRCREAKR
jgi:hypothetical protein